MPFKPLQRLLGIGAVAVALLTAFAPQTAQSLRAQDSGNTITVDGSQIVSPILREASTAYTAAKPDVKVDVQVSGTGGGFEKLCNGTLDINMAVRAITDSEIASCQSKKVDFVELLLGYNPLVVFVNTVSPMTCTSLDQLNALLNPQAAAPTNWNVSDATAPDAPISALYITGKPEDNTQVRVLADTLINGEGLTPNLQVLDDTQKLVLTVATQPNAVGITTLREWTLSGQTGVKALQIRNGTACVDPTEANLDEQRYLASETLYLYINAASLAKTPVVDFLNFLADTKNRPFIRNAGFTVASDTLYERDLSYVANKQTGRSFSRIQSVSVPADTAGAITVEGDPSVYKILQSITTDFTPRYQQITVTSNAMQGNEAGFTRLCANSVDMVGATRLPTDAEQQACQAANLATVQVPLGYQAVVLVVNPKNTATCLKSEEVRNLFGGMATAKTWKDINASFPETPLLLLAPTAGDFETDLLLTKVSPEQVAPYRRIADVTENSDTYYRAAGVQNVEGAVTYMTYTEYQEALKRGIQVKAVSLDTGNGCVEPTEQNIKDGKYAVARPLYVFLNVNSFTRPEIRAYVWYLLSDDALTVLNKSNLVGIDTASIISARDTVLSRFTAATATTPSTSATAEATSAATAEANAAATAVATSPATAEATTAK